MNDEDSKSETPTDEPEIADWSNPNPEEAAELLKRSPEELARLAVVHPPLAQFLSVGFEALTEVREGDRDSIPTIGTPYFETAKSTIAGLLKRLDQDGVSDQERARIYEIIDSTQKQSGEKTSELLDANNKSSRRTQFIIGGLLTVGIIVAANLTVKGSLPPQALS
jgi:hypothetical protein